MTFLELYGTRIDTLIGSVDRTQRFTTERRKIAINDAQREFNRLTECFQRQTTITLTDEVGEYDLEAVITAADYLWLSKQGPEIKKTDASANVLYYSGDDFQRCDLPKLNREEPGWRNASAGTPYRWYLRDDGGRVYFGLYPAPDVQAGETWEAIIPYVAQPADMSADGDVPFTASTNAKTSLAAWHQGLAHYGAAQMELLRKNTTGYQEQMQLFGGYVADYTSKQRPRGGQRVTLARNYFRRGPSRIQMDPRR
jgi:hypothetical protein